MIGMLAAGSTVNIKFVYQRAKLANMSHDLM
jgi:hypothetical protein